MPAGPLLLDGGDEGTEMGESSRRKQRFAVSPLTRSSADFPRGDQEATCEYHAMEDKSSNPTRSPKKVPLSKGDAYNFAAVHSGTGGHISPRESPLSCTVRSAPPLRQFSVAASDHHRSAVQMWLGTSVLVRSPSSPDQTIRSASTPALQPRMATLAEVADQKARVRYADGDSQWVPLALVEKTVSLTELFRVTDRFTCTLPMPREMDKDLTEAIEDEASVADQAAPAPSTWREVVWCLFEPGQAEKSAEAAPHLKMPSRAISVLSQLVIVVSVVVIIVDTMPEFAHGEDGTEVDPDLFAIEASCVAFFTFEFLVRVCTCPSQRQFWLDGFTWIDFCSIVPFYMMLMGTTAWQGLQQVRVLRIVARSTRAARVIKVGRHSVGIRLFALALRRSFSPLAWYCLTLVVLVVCWSTVLYYAERESCKWSPVDRAWYRRPGYKDSAAEGEPPVRCIFQSVPEALWWAVVTLTTVGYGDTYPVTVPGKIVASLTMMMGVIVLAFPMVILTHSFSTVYDCYVFARQGKGDGEKVEVDPEILEQFGTSATRQSTGLRTSSAKTVRRESSNTLACDPAGGREIAVHPVAS
eukprot:TRINITY_DN32793_c0_g1_i1.p1 TRINITY_DN32793_c0_g1~~TRINITY_DN32793_c0_g1_i1.p1  ORF type:complete len:582 (+),score=188.77 TRINITY_DN32793_c0_g1_i1:59-1804(+)